MKEMTREELRDHLARKLRAIRTRKAKNKLTDSDHDGLITFDGYPVAAWLLAMPLLLGFHAAQVGTMRKDDSLSTIFCFRA